VKLPAQLELISLCEHHERENTTQREYVNRFLFIIFTMGKGSDYSDDRFMNWNTWIKIQDKNVRYCQQLSFHGLQFTNNYSWHIIHDKIVRYFLSWWNRSFTHPPKMRLHPKSANVIIPLVSFNAI